DGHQVVDGSGGSVEVESTRWPFCFDASPTEATSTRSILPFCTFNEDLNRLTLVVTGLGTPKAKVTWGGESKEFTKEQLAGGVNLAAEFPKTPFDDAFRSLMDAVGVKQAFETMAIKNLVTNFRIFAEEAKADPEFGAALDTLKKKVTDKEAQHDASVRKRLVPVRHAIKVEPLP
ncbi:MAG: hypothetical protein KDM63_18200, partial [Verrucomicrobiae bacterium]|nr:hypothetical protein [Verrucomicrobiae bacterium]